MFYSFLPWLFHWFGEIHLHTLQASSLAGFHFWLWKKGFYLITSPKGKISYPSQTSPWVWNLRPGYSPKSGWKMYFNGSGCCRSKALYKWNQYDYPSCGAFLMPSLDVWGFMTRIRTLALFRVMECLSSLVLRKALPCPAVFGLFLFCLWGCFKSWCH